MNISKALKQTSTGKSAGPDGMANEMLCDFEYFVVEKLSEVANDIHKSGENPNDLPRLIFIAIPKRKLEQ